MYNPGDIAAINAIIAGNGLGWTPAGPADGSYVPADWKGVTWSDDALNKRVVGLNVTNEGLTGSLNVSGLSKLAVLNCNDNTLTALNVSGLTALSWLDCVSNNLTALNVSGLTALSWLNCMGNDLSALDVSGLTALQWLLCINNNLNTLNVSGLTALELLDCTLNNLAALNVSGLTALKSLFCSGNNLTALDVSKNPKLADLQCHSNRLSRLNVSGLSLSSLHCQYNNMADESAVAGFTGPWGASSYVFHPQNATISPKSRTFPPAMAGYGTQEAQRLPSPTPGRRP